MHSYYGMKRKLLHNINSLLIFFLQALGKQWVRQTDTWLQTKSLQPMTYEVSQKKLK